MTVWFDFSSS